MGWESEWAFPRPVSMVPRDSFKEPAGGLCFWTLRCPFVAHGVQKIEWAGPVTHDVRDQARSRRTGRRVGWLPHLPAHARVDAARRGLDDPRGLEATRACEPEDHHRGLLVPDGMRIGPAVSLPRGLLGDAQDLSYRGPGRAVLARGCNQRFDQPLAALALLMRLAEPRENVVLLRLNAHIVKDA
jgi:hypothetical protein